MPSAGLSSCGVNGVVTLDCIFPLLASIVSWAILFAGTVALFMIIFGGIRLLTSGGDPKTVESGKKTLTYAIAGLVLIFLAFFIMRTIAYVTGVVCVDPRNPMSFTSCT